MRISIIIVHYQVEEIIFKCLKSIYSQKSNYSFEVILVDNGSLKHFKHRLKKQFPKVKYVLAKMNLGYGGGNNVGARIAQGRYLFFLNPDTQLKANCINILTSLIDSHQHYGIVAPTLIHPDGSYFSNQGAMILSPVTAVAAHSVLHRIWPNNPVSKVFWLKDVNKSKDRLVEVVPGTALMIDSTLFRQIDGFDPNFFLYFEEYDLCLKVLAQNKKILMSGKARVVHQWEATTKNIDKKKIYQKSFKYYLVKHFGVVGLVSYLLCQISAIQLLFTLAFVTAAVIYWIY